MREPGSLDPRRREHLHARYDLIEVRGLEVFAHHGVYPHEREEGQRFRVDIELDVDTRIPAQSDNIDDAVDYGAVVREVADLVRSTRYHLLERLANRIVEHLLNIPRVAAASVRICKPDVELGEQVDEVAVTVRRARRLQL